jgi:D-alanyl-lipoteichoic acid acyltransferase DltB (MBOAT superfamily)
MLFNSIAFLVFFIVVFLVYWLLNNRSSLNARNLFLLATSYYFYGCWDKRFLLLIVISSLIDFLCGLYLEKEKKNLSRKLILAVSLTLNLGLLGFFKYYNFFIESFVDLSHLVGFNANVNTLTIILPVGISFYTFQTMSYTIDIYRRSLKPVTNPLSFFTYVAFFPQLVAGPIERASNLLPQLIKKQHFDKDYAESGLRFILWGLFKKMVIADRVSILVEQVYNQPAEYSGFVLFVATLLFGIQIYCDFSGYSDIAIGTSRLLGIQLMDNFRTPYFSASFRDFWQRWHISLSTWFRDYLYIPLGGNRRGKLRTYFNLMATFVVSGLWHGANYTFLIWGFLHGLFLTVERYLLSVVRLRVSVFVKIVFVYVVVNLTWIFFRANNLTEAFLIFKRIFSATKGNLPFANLLAIGGREQLLAVIVGMLIFIPFEFLIGKGDFNQACLKYKLSVRWMIYYFLIVIILVFGVLNSAPQFIYFQF